MLTADLMPPPDRRSPDAAQRWLAACVADYEALRTLEREALTVDEDPAKIARAREIHAAWGRWAEEAEAAWEGFKDDPSLDPDEQWRFPGLLKFGRVMARTDLAKLRRAHADMLAGNTIDGRELFRELGIPRDPRRQRRAAPAGRGRAGGGV